MASNAPAPKPPLNPWAVLAVAALLPGMGQVLNNNATRAIVFVFFVISLAIVSYHLTTSAQSFLGRHAGGVFIYVISLVDAYRIASLRWDLYRLPAK
ncbi:MAG: hypothetical protein EXR36_01420 [Betaproteobacteria bacterium]|nr:hypothetical protein [Betaproteobacteria bacterium]